MQASRAERARVARRASEEESRPDSRAPSPEPNQLRALSRSAPRAQPPPSPPPLPHLYLILHPSPLPLSQDLAIAHLESQLLRTSAWSNAPSWQRQSRSLPPAARGALPLPHGGPLWAPGQWSLGPAVQPLGPSEAPLRKATLLLMVSLPLNIQAIVLYSPWLYSPWLYPLLPSRHAGGGRSTAAPAAAQARRHPISSAGRGGRGQRGQRQR